MNKTFITNNVSETLEFGYNLANILPSGITVCLSGDLGAGKTTLVRGLAHGLRINEIVQSPTFNIMKIYLKGTRPLIHIDAYRLADINSDIGLDEYIGYESGITVIEWADFISYLIPKKHVEIKIHRLGDEQREFVIEDPNNLLGDL